MTPELIQWAQRNSVTMSALLELDAIFGCDKLPTQLIHGKSESAVQSIVRLEASKKGVTLWRNNVGALLDARGVPVRYGLANDSKQLNARIKSGDLIGWRTITITPDMIGARIAQFVSRECKKPDWSYSGTAHELAQLRWIQAVTMAGGDAKFCNGEGTL